jgi:hypothetical protein
MLDDRTIAEYADDGHTGPHLPLLAPEAEGPRPAEACPSPPGILSGNSQLPTINSSAEPVKPEQAKREPETCNLKLETVVRPGARRSRRGLKARKHGILASILSGNERRKLNRLAARFAGELNPVGTVEESLVEKIAITSLRLQRCAFAESIYYDATWRPQPGRKIRSIEDLFNAYWFEKNATLISRYDTALTNQLTKLLREFAEAQAARLARAGDPAAKAQTDSGCLQLREDV